MKRLIFLLVVAMAGAVCAGVAHDHNYYYQHRTTIGSSNRSVDPVYLFMQDVVGSLGGITAGEHNTWYVNSNVTSEGDGTSWTKAKDTLNEAIDLCDANDVIYVAAGHTETMGSAADEVDIDVAGLIIIGLGGEGMQPKFDYTGDVTGAFAIGADYITLMNLNFHANVADVNEAVEIEAGSVGATIVGCLFDCESEGTDAFLECIDSSGGAASDRLTVLGCQFRMGAGACNSAICTKDSDYMIVRGCIAHGDYAVANINNVTTASNHVLIADNYLFNGTIGGDAGLNDQPCIELVATTTGMIVNNTLVCNVGTPDVAIVGADMYLDGNVYTETEATSPGPMWLTTDNAHNIIGYNDSDNDASTSSVAGNADGSIVERLEQINQDLDGLTGMAFRGDCTTNAVTTTVVSSDLAGWGDDFFNTGWVIICTYDASGAGTAPEGEVRDITNYVSSTGTFTVAAFTAALTENDKVLVKRQEDMNPHDPGILNASGNIWYLDDGGSNGDGKTWQSAKTTLAAVEALCSAGDTILVGRSHNEALTTGGDTINVAGVSVIGMGDGNSRPLFDMDVDSDELTLDAAGITLRNLRFRPGATGLTSGVRVEDDGDGCVIDNCAFVDGEAAGTDEWTDCISVDTSATDLTVRNCTFYSTGAPGTWINLDEATIANATIVGCTMYGACSEAPIWGAAAVPTNLFIKDNIITNTDSGQLCIEFQGNATGVICDNMLYSDTHGSILDPGYCKCYGNQESPGTDSGPMDVPLIAGKTYVISTTTDGSANTDNMFDVSGGPIMIISLFGQSTAAGAGNPGNMTIECDATAGANYDNDLSTTVTVDTIGEGDTIRFSNAIDEGVLDITANVGAGQPLNWFCPAGTIEQTLTSTGTLGITWYMTFIPLESDVVVVPSS